MTAAQRQARRRRKLREAAKLKLEQPLGRRLYQPLPGYGLAKEQLIAAGHCFERARREAGFEEGVFVDGALLSSSEVIAFAELPLQERRRRLAEQRRATKDFACTAVAHYMQTLQVTRDELFSSSGARVLRGEPKSTSAALPGPEKSTS
jgi:hypothetical protein